MTDKNDYSKYFKINVIWEKIFVDYKNKPIDFQKIFDKIKPGFIEGDFDISLKDRNILAGKDKDKNVDPKGRLLTFTMRSLKHVKILDFVMRQNKVIEYKCRVMRKNIFVAYHNNFCYNKETYDEVTKILENLLDQEITNRYINGQIYALKTNKLNFESITKILNDKNISHKTSKFFHLTNTIKFNYKNDQDKINADVIIYANGYIKLFNQDQPDINFKYFYDYLVNLLDIKLFEFPNNDVVIINNDEKQMIIEI